MNQKGYIIVLSGPSGAGKGTIISKLCSQRDYALSLSWTTRQPRKQEKDGIDYHFKTIKEFEAMISENGFIEYARYGSHYYGTPKDFVARNISEGRDVILEIEVQGAAKIRQSAKNIECSGIIFIFIAPPSIAVLEERLRKRATETEEKIAERINTAREEIKHINEYEYIIINDNINKALKELKNAVDASEGKIPRCKAENNLTAGNMDFINKFLEGDNKNA